MKNSNYVAEQEFKKVFPKLYQQEKLYEDKFAAAANKFSMIHQNLYPKHKANPIIQAHPSAGKNPKLLPLKKNLEKLASIYNNYGSLIAKKQDAFVKKYGDRVYSMLFKKYDLKKYL